MIEAYTKRVSALNEQIIQLQKKDDKLSTGRLLGFLFFLAALIVSISSGSLLWSGVAFVMFIVFIRIILLDLHNKQQLTRATTTRNMLENEISVLALQPNTYYNGDFFRDPEHPYTHDMDIFGVNSLFAYINRCATGVGNRALANWLKEPSSQEQIIQRQEAIKEIAEQQQWSENLRIPLFAKRIQNFSKQFLPGIDKMDTPAASYKYWIFASHLLLVLSILAIVFLGVSAAILTLTVVLNVIIQILSARFVKNIKSQLEGREQTLSEYEKILSDFEQTPWKSACLNAMLNELRHEQKGAVQAIHNLRKLSLKLEYTLNMVMFVILNVFLLWDLKISIRIASWFEKYAHKTIQWFDVAGRIEALVSLANVQKNHPQWNYPVFQNTAFKFSAKNLGHPLLAQHERVCNDFEIKGLDKINIITGSNMAGKSTFLRSVGVNIILAHAGLPVCADQMTLSHFRIMTYLTITDSLSEHTSTFYREIKRLKKILDSARADNNVLLLLDELLRGTNSADKARGSMAITRELIMQNIPAIIATHNLELADMENDFPNNISNHFFDIIIDDDSTMRFDYKLKPGICNTFNASLLLREIGINIEKK